MAVQSGDVHQRGPVLGPVKHRGLKRVHRINFGSTGISSTLLLIKYLELVCQELDRPRVPPLGRQVHGGAILVVREGGVGAGEVQGADHVLVAVLGGEVEHGLAVALDFGKIFTSHTVTSLVIKTFS